MNLARDFKELVPLLKETYNDWNEDKAPRLGAALAYYTVFSMAPFLIVLLAIAGLAFDNLGIGARDQVLAQISDTFGESGGRLISTMIENANHKGSGVMATVIGTATLLMGAGGLFGQLQDALNTIWGVAPKPGLGFMATVKTRFLSFSMVLVTGFLLLVSLALSALLQALSTYMNDVLPVPGIVLTTLNLLIGFGVITLLFAMIYKVLPDAEIEWRDVWIGAAVTSLLFSIGKFALSLYLSKSAPGSTYGEAGSLVLILLWVYYAAQILFFGAEFTQVYARKFGSRIVPSPNAIAVSPEAFAKQGIPRADTIEAALAGPTAVVVPELVPVPPTAHSDAKQRIGKPRSGPDYGFLVAVASGFAAMVTIGSWRKKKAGLR